MRSIDGSSDVSSSDLGRFVFDFGQNFAGWVRLKALAEASTEITLRFAELLNPDGTVDQSNLRLAECTDRFVLAGDSKAEVFEPHFTYHGFRRSEEHTSELQSLMRISYAVFCLKKKKTK